MDQDEMLKKVLEVVERSQTSRDKVLACVYAFQLVGAKIDMHDFSPADIGEFIGLPADLVKAVLDSLKAEGLVEMR